MPIQSANQPEVTHLDQWLGLNQQARRGTINDQEQWWNENLFTIGPGNLRSCWGPGPALYTAPAGTTILRIFFGFIGYPTPQFAAPGPPYGGRLGWMFLSNGHVVQIDLDGLSPTTDIGAIWEPVSPQYWASAKVWRPRFFGSVLGQQGGVLFGSPQGYYAWDGQTLTSPGEPAPDWLTDIAETDPSGPIPPMPSGLPGIYTMEVFQSRMFVGGKDVLSFSAPSNGADFSTTDGGGSLGYFGDKLTYTYMDFASSSGYMYVFGDSSVDVISNIQLLGSGTPTAPFTTNFSYANVDPQVGHRFPRPVGRVNRYFVVWSGDGFHMLQGADSQPIGDKVTNIYNTLDTSLYLPTSCAATMFGFKVLLCNGRFTDPWGVKRNLLLMWHPVGGQPFWSVASQHYELTHIGHYQQDNVIIPYGTDGTNLYQLFAAPDPKLPKKLSSKALRGTGLAQLSIKNFKRIYYEVHDNSGLGVSMTGNLTSGGGGVPGGVEDIYFQMNPGEGYRLDGHGLTGGGIWAQIDLNSLSPDFTLERIHLAAEERTLFGA